MVRGIMWLPKIIVWCEHNLLLDVPWTHPKSDVEQNNEWADACSGPPRGQGVAARNDMKLV